MTGTKDLLLDKNKHYRKQVQKPTLMRTSIAWMTEKMVVRKMTVDRKTALMRNSWPHKGRRMHHVGK